MAAEPAQMMVGEIAVDGRQVTARPAIDQDTDFLRALYASTREAELACVPWTPEVKQRFLDQQFRAQDHAYRNNYAGAEFLILMVDGQRAGRISLHRRPTGIVVMDLALLPAFRGQGIGTAVLHRVQEIAAQSHRGVTIHVEIFNPAARLYQRLGFVEVSRTEVYALMEWRPGTGTAPEV